MIMIDISWPLSPSLTQYKNRRDFSVQKTQDFVHDKVRSSLITIGSHTGTHVDAPAHFLRDGATLDQIALEKTCGPCIVIDLTHVKECITAETLQSYTFNHTILLLKTKNSFLESNASFNPDFIYLEKSGAQLLANAGIKSIGIDYLGIERNQPDHETHTYFLEKEIPIIEGLRLGHVDAGNYILYCLPLALQGTEAAPARALLIKE